MRSPIEVTPQTTIIGTFSLDAQTEEDDFKKIWEEIFERFPLTADKLDAKDFVMYFAYVWR